MYVHGGGGGGGGGGGSVCDGLVVIWGVSVDTTLIHTFLSAPACNDMVYSKDLKSDGETSAMAKELPCLKTLASFLHST